MRHVRANDRWTDGSAPPGLHNREGFFVHAAGVGCDADWGAVPAVPHAAGVSGAAPEGSLARYDFGFAGLVLSDNAAKGLLIIAAFATFRDGSGRSSDFTREYFHRETAGAESAP